MALMGMFIVHVPELMVELERRVSSGEDLELLKDFVQRNTHLIARKT